MNERNLPQAASEPNPDVGTPIYDGLMHDLAELARRESDQVIPQTSPEAHTEIAEEPSAAVDVAAARAAREAARVRAEEIREAKLSIQACYVEDWNECAKRAPRPFVPDDVAHLFDVDGFYKDPEDVIYPPRLDT